MVIEKGNAMQEGTMPTIWVGIDAGKWKHHVVLLDAEGKTLLSQTVKNDETALLELLSSVIALAAGAPLRWAIDLNSGGSALLVALLAAHEQELVYIPGRIIHHAAATYRGDGKTDAKDARIIADQARIRSDLRPPKERDQASVDLHLLTARRLDLVHDRVRTINRLRATLLEYFPALEASFDYSKRQAALLLLTKYATPQTLRRAGKARLTRWLQARECRTAGQVADKALAAAAAQATQLPTQTVAAELVAELANDVLRLDSDISRVDSQIKARLQDTTSGALLQSMPGFGPVLAAAFIARTGSDLTEFESPDHLASAAGLAPVPRDSGRITGNNHRPKRFDRILLRTCYLAAHSSLKNSPASRAYYHRKRSEGKSHKQALIALARRRLNVIWAMLRDQTPFQEPAANAA